jgi:trans-aconitate 2-methyltransferase
MGEAMDESVADFYDEFRDRRMLSYRLGLNRRLRLANRFVTAQIDRSSSVLEVGCGIGLTTKKLARRAREGQVWAVDLSRRNIELARRLARRGNISWAVADILDDSYSIDDWVRSPVDRIILVDVLEHIPRSSRSKLFAELASVSRDDARIILTFPSVAYQRHLRATNPSELQPVDEEVFASDLEHQGSEYGFSLTYWNVKDAWLTGQYVHAVLERGKALTPVKRIAHPVMIRWRQRLAACAQSALARWYRDRPQR